MADLVRLKSNHTLKALLSALGKSKELIIYLEIPSGSTLWETKNLRLIRRAGIELKKKLVLITSGRVSKIRAEQAGLTVVSPENIFQGKPLTTNLPAEVAKNTSAATLGTSPAEWVSKKTDSREIVWLSSPRRKIFYISAAAIAVAAGFLVANFYLSSAEITVYSRVASAQSSMDIIVREPVLGEEFTPNAVSGGKITQTKSKTSEFQSTGQKNTGAKARGNVYLRSSNPSTLTLRSDTTYLESSSGKKYRFSGNVTGLRAGIPQLVAIEAEESGSESNITAGTRLEVHNSAFGYRPQVLYADVADTGIVGGNNESVKVVSASDLAKAQASIIDSLVEEVQNELRGWGGEAVLLNELTDVRVVSADYNAQVDDAKESFNTTVKVEIKGLWFDQNKITQMLEAEMKRSLPSNQKVVGVEPGSHKYAIRSWDFDKGIPLLNLGYNIFTTH